VSAASSDSGDEPQATPPPLPEAVRSRVVGLASDALAALEPSTLPAPLRRVASFAPARRARLAATQIASAVARDAGFRERVAVQVRAALPELCLALDRGEPPAAADPAELAAVAYLLRCDGWLETLTAATEALSAERSTAVIREEARRVEQLRRQLEVATEELRQSRRRQRDQVSELKAENAELRHRLADTRARLREAEEAAREAAAEVASLTSAATTATSEHEAELRRLRVRVEQLERDLASTRRAERAERDTGTLRTRLLVDTLVETAQGLRRELALPAAEGSPADRVEAHVAEEGSRAPSGHASMSAGDPALLDQLVALPRAHLVVDGYNVTKTSWPELSLERQRDRLLTGLAPLVARRGTEVTVVFDAGATTERPVVSKPRGVRVLFSPLGVIADDVIRDLVAAEPRGRPVIVVSNDQEVVRDVLHAGARVATAGALTGLISRA
jgi:predicted RNA-binding protein with PIN domain/phage shock protein A